MAVKPRDTLISEKSKKLFKVLTKEYEQQYGVLDDPARHLINDISMLEDIKQGCLDDINERGLMIYWKNGNDQEGYREHPLIPKLNQATEQQRKLMNDLKLTPSARKAVATQQGGDDFEAF